MQTNKSTNSTCDTSFIPYNPSTSYMPLASLKGCIHVYSWDGGQRSSLGVSKTSAQPGNKARYCPTKCVVRCVLRSCLRIQSRNMQEGLSPWLVHCEHYYTVALSTSLGFFINLPRDWSHYKSWWHHTYIHSWLCWQLSKLQFGTNNFIAKTAISLINDCRVSR